MKKERITAIEKEITRVISKTILEEIRNPKVHGVVSVTKCIVTPDLKFADVYFSVLDPEHSELKDENSKFEEKIFLGLVEIKGFLRKRISEELDIRYTPEVRPHLDEGIKHLIEITKILDDIKNK